MRVDELPDEGHVGIRDQATAILQDYVHELQRSRMAR
jgi:hypothetical protein